MSETEVDKLYEEFKSLLNYLENEITYYNIANDVFRKALLLASASYFEKKVSEGILNLLEGTTYSEIMTEFIKNKVLKRQYYQLFNWDQRNANQFFGFFGEDFRKYMQNEVENNSQFERSIREFMFIGSYRNQIAHEFSDNQIIDKTTKEIHESYQHACEFITIFQAKAKHYIDMRRELKS